MMAHLHGGATKGLNLCTTPLTKALVKRPYDVMTYGGAHW